MASFLMFAAIVAMTLIASVVVEWDADFLAQEPGKVGEGDGKSEGEGEPSEVKGPRFHVTSYPKFEMRWRVVDDPMGPRALGSLPKDEVEVWRSPYAKGHVAVGVGNELMASGVLAVLGDGVSADPLWNLRKATVNGRAWTDAASWGGRALHAAAFDPSMGKDRADAFAWRRSPEPSMSGMDLSSAWDVPHSPFEMEVGEFGAERLLLRYRRENVEGKWRYWTDVVSVRGSRAGDGEGAVLATIEGLADAPTVWGPYVLMRKYVGAGDESELVVLSVERRREAGKELFENTGVLRGPFAVDLRLEGARVLGKPVWIMARESWNARRAFPGRQPVFVVSASSGDHTTWLEVGLEFEYDNSQMVPEREGIESGAVVGVRAVKADAEFFLTTLGYRAAVSPVADSMAFVPDTAMVGGRPCNAREVDSMLRAYEADHKAWKAAKDAGEEVGAEPVSPIADVPEAKSLGGTLVFLIEKTASLGLRSAVFYRFDGVDSHGGGEVAPHHESAIARRRGHFVMSDSESETSSFSPKSLPIAAIWPVTGVLGKPEFEVLMGGRVWRMLPDGSIAVPASLEGDVPPALPQPDAKSPMRPVGVHAIGSGHAMVWWAKGPPRVAPGDAKEGEVVQTAPRIPTVAEVEAYAGATAPASHRAFEFTIFRDVQLGLAWPKGDAADIHRTDSIVADKYVVPDSWVAENVLMAKRAVAARKARRLGNTVLIYGFDVKVESEQIKNKKGDVIEMFREPFGANGPMLRMEDDFAGEWTVKAWRAGAGAAAGRAWIADDKDKAFRASVGSTVDDLASMARARKLLLLSDADQAGALRSVGLARGFPVDPESGKVWNTRHFVRYGDDGSVADLFFDADGADHELVMARLSFPIASRGGKESAGGHSSIELWLTDYTDLMDFSGKAGAKAQPLRVPKQVRAFTPGTSEVRFVANFKSEIKRASYLNGTTAIRSGFNWDALEVHHFGTTYALDAEEE